MEIKLDKESAAKMAETCDAILREPPVEGAATGSAARQRTIEELGRRFDYCRSQIAVEAIDDFANSRWRKMADNMEKAVRELKLCIHDARLLSNPSNDKLKNAGPRTPDIS